MFINLTFLQSEIDYRNSRLGPSRGDSPRGRGPVRLVRRRDPRAPRR